MAKVEIIQSGLVRFKEIMAGEFFIYDDGLYLKIDASGKIENAFNFRNEFFYSLDNDEMVSKVDSNSITIKVN